MTEKIYYSDTDAKNMICEIGKRLYNKSFVVATDGNVSIKCTDNSLWCTPTNVSKGYLTPDMLVKINLDGETLEGDNKPSSEIKMHIRVYKENLDARAVIHAHPPISTSFAIARIPLNKPILTEAIIFLGEVPVAPYATPGTDEVPDSISPYCKDYSALLLANHGALTWSTDPMSAYYKMEWLEQYALISMYTQNILNCSVELSQGQVSELVKIRENLSTKSTHKVKKT